MRPLLSRTLALAVPALAAGLVFGTPAVRGASEAQANQWQLHASNTGFYCEGCCAPGSLCCSINYPCRVDAPADPAGG
jgi:hypothetical protein